MLRNRVHGRDKTSQSAGVACIAAALALLTAVAAGPTLFAADWPQWRGAERLGIWTETGIATGRCAACGPRPASGSGRPRG